MPAAEPPSALWARSSFGPPSRAPHSGEALGGEAVTGQLPTGVSAGCPQAVPRSDPHAVRLQLMPAVRSLCTGTGPGRQMRQGIIDGRKHWQPLVQAADLQHPRHSRLRRDQPVPAPCPVGMVGDLDECAEPTGVAKGQAAQVKQQQPGMGDGGTGPARPAGRRWPDPAHRVRARPGSRRRGLQPSPGSRTGSLPCLPCRRYRSIVAVTIAR